MIGIGPMSRRIRAPMLGGEPRTAGRFDEVLGCPVKSARAVLSKWVAAGGALTSTDPGRRTKTTRTPEGRRCVWEAPRHRAANYLRVYGKISRAPIPIRRNRSWPEKIVK